MVKKKQRDICDQLREAIEASGLTSYRLAKTCGVSQPTIDRFMSGERDVYGKTLAKLCEALGLKLVSRK